MPDACVGVLVVEQNLQGQNEIIGVADSGVDMNHCQFREDDGDNVEASEWDNPVTDTSKRKVVQYIAFVDDFDGEFPAWTRQQLFL